jgi:hypothetical protein
MTFLNANTSPSSWKRLSEEKDRGEVYLRQVIDPFNDFISEGGKIWDRVKAVAEANNCVSNMLQGN